MEKSVWFHFLIGMLVLLVVGVGFSGLGNYDEVVSYSPSAGGFTIIFARIEAMFDDIDDEPGGGNPPESGPPSNCNSDGICDSSESYDTCPMDCSPEPPGEPTCWEQATDEYIPQLISCEDNLNNIAALCATCCAGRYDASSDDEFDDWLDCHNGCGEALDVLLELC